MSMKKRLQKGIRPLAGFVSLLLVFLASPATAYIEKGHSGHQLMGNPSLYIGVANVRELTGREEEPVPNLINEFGQDADLCILAICDTYKDSFIEQ